MKFSDVYFAWIGVYYIIAGTIPLCDWFKRLLHNPACCAPLAQSRHCQLLTSCTVSWIVFRQGALIPPQKLKKKEIRVLWSIAWNWKYMEFQTTRFRAQSSVFCYMKLRNGYITGILIALQILRFCRSLFVLLYLLHSIIYSFVHCFC